MIPLVFLLLLSEIGQGTLTTVNKDSGVTQDSGVMKAVVGDTVTLKCFWQNEAVTFLSWYQQSLGGKPDIISSRMKHKEEADIFHAYKERFEVSVQSKEGSNHLTIKDLRLADAATYYCGILEFNAVEFGQGVFLHVTKSQSNIQAVVHQPELEPLRPGSPLNLICTVHAESQCTEESRLYWFRRGASQPMVMDPSAGQCTSPSDELSPIKNCTANLEFDSLSYSDAGMYYCAIASCGEIVFGNGTRVELIDVSTSPMVHFLSVALAVSCIVLPALAFSVYKLNKNLCSVCKGSASHLTCSSAPDTMSGDADTLHYAALNLKRNREQHRHNSHMETECTYSSVKSRKE